MGAVTFGHFDAGPRLDSRGPAQPHNVSWTPEQVARFWDWMGAQPAMREAYFSRERGDAILDVAKRYVRLKNSVAIDLGAGPGYLTEKLMRRGANVLAADTSWASVDALSNRLQGQPRFLGAYTIDDGQVPLPDAIADLIFVIETVEHLDREALPFLMNEVYRLLKRGGAVVITTPNDENLLQASVLCPECGCVFHNMQHVRSWTLSSLKQCMEEYKLHTVVCCATVFGRVPAFLRPFNRYAYVASGVKLPHLLYIGRR
jgi:SAM-dependent methyltransferase